MEKKVVFFGRIKTLQIKCPKCDEWQFESKICCECNYEFNKKEDVKFDRIEYRSEVTTWRDHIKDSLKQKVYERDEFVCQYCGIWCYESWVMNDKSLTIDHLMPVSGGGMNNIENLITACRECNMIKNDKRFKTFEEAREYIFSKKKYETV